MLRCSECAAQVATREMKLRADDPFTHNSWVEALEQHALYNCNICSAAEFTHRQQLIIATSLSVVEYNGGEASGAAAAQDSTRIENEGAVCSQRVWEKFVRAGCTELGV